MKVTVDRIEGETAVLLVRPDENLKIIFPRELLPGVGEGDVLEIAATRELHETKEAREQVSSVIDKFREK